MIKALVIIGLVLFLIIWPVLALPTYLIYLISEMRNKSRIRNALNEG